MKINTVCVDNSGFEDILTTGKEYNIVPGTLNPTGSTVTIINDKGVQSSHGLVNLHLQEVKCTCKKK